MYVETHDVYRNIGNYYINGIMILKLILLTSIPNFLEYNHIVGRNIFLFNILHINNI